MKKTEYRNWDITIEVDMRAGYPRLLIAGITQDNHPIFSEKGWIVEYYSIIENEDECFGRFKKIIDDMSIIPKLRG